MRLLKKIRSLKGKQKAEFIIASFLTITLLIVFPVLAWFSNNRNLETITKIREPGDIIIRAGKSDAAASDADPIVNFEMKEIDIEDVASGNSAQYVFSVKPGDYTTKYDLVLAHTTNIPFTYTIYKASDVDTAGMTEEQKNALVIYHPRNDSTKTTYYKKGDKLDMTELNTDSGDTGRNLAEKNDEYYNNTYDAGDDPEMYAVPIYMKTDKSITHSKDSEDSYDYFILEINWDENTGTGNYDKWNKAVNNKETDMIYITAFNSES